MRRIGLHLSSFAIGGLLLSLLVLTPDHGWALLVQVETQGGYQTNNFGWTIAGPGGRPNILSELNFKSHGPKGQLSVQWSTDNQLFFAKTLLGYSPLTGGQVQDDDYFLDNRQGQFSSSHTTIGGNGIQHAVLDIGWRPLRTEQISLALLGGFQYDFQSYRITTPGTQLNPPGAVTFDGLNSMYNWRTYGFSLGLNAIVPIGSLPLSFILTGHYLPSLTYIGKGFWNLRGGSAPSDFRQDPSYRHDAKGTGGDLDLSLRLRLTEHWHTSIGTQFTWMKIKAGDDQTFFQDGSAPIIPFNGADLRSRFFYGSVGFRW